MDQVIKIEGQHKLNGEVTISGSKNSAVALIPACVLASEPVTLFGVPDISDVQVLIRLLRDLGCKVDYDPEGTLRIDPTEITNKPMYMEDVSKLRGSYYFMGALLGRFGHCEILSPGGCFLGDRPIDLHLKGFRALNARVHDLSDTVVLDSDQLKGSTIFLDIPSVGATINIMLAAALMEGETTVIENAAREPEIIDVATLLNKMGADIYGMGTSTLTIHGVSALKGANHEVIPDRIEAATYILIAAAMAEDVTIRNVIPKHLEAVLSKLKELGIRFDVNSREEFVRVHGNRHDVVLNKINIETKPYPGFATDVQQPFTPLLMRANGTSIVKDTIYNQRFKHVHELRKMNARINLASPRAYIEGPQELKGAVVTATDLRGGAAMVIAGLMAEGVTEIHDVYHIDRGYDHLDEKLRALGAKIWREYREKDYVREDLPVDIKRTH